MASELFCTVCDVDVGNDGRSTKLTAQHSMQLWSCNDHFSCVIIALAVSVDIKLVAQLANSLSVS